MTITPQALAKAQKVLAIKIRAYAKSKKARQNLSDDATTTPNDEKGNFFSSLAELMENNQLTVKKLNEKLAGLKDKKRFKLFYRARKITLLRASDDNYYKTKSSVDSKAAQWLKTIYASLGIHLSDLSLATLVAEGLNEENTKKLDNIHYNRWLKNPLSSWAQARLEHELKGHLGLKNMIADKSLAQLLKEQPQDSLPGLFEELHKAAPDYLPTVVNQFFELFEDKQTCLELLATVAAGEKPELTQALSRTNVAIAEHFVDKNKITFPQLPSYLQHPVLASHESKISPERFRGFLETIKPDADLMSDNKLRAKAVDPGHQHNRTFSQLVDEIHSRLVADEAELSPPLISQLNYYQGAEAISKINNYLHSQPNEYKADFYTHLREDIRRNGLTVAVLNRHFEPADKNKLFYSFWGQKNSQAEKLMAELVRLANYSDKAPETFKNKIVADECFTDQQTAFLKKKIARVLNTPAEANKSALGHTIAEDGIAYYQGIQLAHSKLKEHRQKQAEAIYQQYLIEKALAAAENSEDLQIFDPQAHVLIQLDLNADDYQTILDRIDVESAAPKETLEEILGTRLTDSTVCNVDIIKHLNLRKKFEKKFLEGAEDLKDALDSYLDSGERGSVIALQEELTMHVSLCLRAIEKIVKETPLLDPERIKRLRVNINNLVWKRFKTAFEKSYDTKAATIDYVALNKNLDEARRELAENCRQDLVTALQQAGKINDDFISDFEKKAKDSDFTSTTATGMDYLRSDASLQTVVRITATEKTAHDKEINGRVEPEKQAFRMLARNKYDGSTNTVTPYADATCEARVPSIADKKAESHLAVKDVAAKLKHSQTLLRKKASAYRGPLVYNLLTSLHTKAFGTLFDRRNKQRPSAARILKGAHKFNAEQVKKREIEALIYVQNIPVNQHTDKVTVKAFDDATAEAALMRDLALLSTFKHYAAVFPPVLRQDLLATYGLIHNHYLDFLRSEAGRDGKNYFKNFYTGKQAIATLERKKAEWQQAAKMEPADDIRTLAAQALFKMMVNNEHEDKQFGMLAQALAVFIEPMSQAGCKSANERYQAVAGRVEVLHALSQVSFGAEDRPHSAFMKARDSLKNYVAGKAGLEKVQASVDKLYNETNLQGSAASFSEEDQGAPSKVRASLNENKGMLKASEVSTNIAESGFLTRLSQKLCKAMQAHHANLPAVFTGLFKRSDAVPSSSPSGPSP